ncbi:MAG TPA: hypothetical protein VIL46_04055, partial [Gemmataceae bacterium]
LEPHEKFDPYRQWKRQQDELLRELSELPDVKKPEELKARITRLVKEGSKGKQSAEIRMCVLADSLPLAPRVGEEFTLSLLQQVPPVLRATANVNDPTLSERQGKLLERAVFFAAHFDRVEQVQALVNQFTELLRSKSGSDLYRAIDLLAGECLRGLRKLGLRDEIHRLLEEMRELVVRGQSLPQLRARGGAAWPEMLRTLLHLASGWLCFGWLDQAEPSLDEAREELFRQAAAGDKKMPVHDYTKLARTYVSVLGQAPVDRALDRIEEMFRRMDGLTNTFTTATHYSRLHLNVIEEVVRSVVSEDFAMGPTARRWLDDDEYLVRRRIHRDLRAMMAHAAV